MRRQENQQVAIDDHESRIKNIETLVTTANTEITKINTLIKALEGKVSIESYTELADKLGYELLMSDGSKIVLKNGDKGDKGDSPVINVAKHTDGLLYWTLNGKWMLDASENKIPATGKNGKDGQDGKDGLDGKDGIAPQLRVNTANHWELSTDGGSTWQELKDARGNPVPATGSKGDKGDKGEDGKDGADGQDGKDGQDGDANLTITETATAVTIVYKGVTYTIPKGGGGSGAMKLNTNAITVKLTKPARFT